MSTTPGPSPVGPASTGAVFELRLLPDERRLPAPADRPLLTSARDAGVILRSSCRNGTCRACICKMVSGRVAYRIEWPGLSLDEKEEGWILPCVAHPLSDVAIELFDPFVGLD